jgi:hypothetical protein
MPSHQPTSENLSRPSPSLAFPLFRNTPTATTAIVGAAHFFAADDGNHLIAVTVSLAHLYR